MMISLSGQELLAEWKMRLGLLEQDCGCQVGTHDGGAMESLLRSRLQSWYSRMLLEADPALLPHSDVSAQIEWARTSADGEMRLLLPAQGGQVVSVRLAGWKRAVTQIVEPGSPEEVMSRFPALEPSEDEPIAVLRGRMLSLRPAAVRTGNTASDVAELVMTGPEQKDLYEMDAALLDLLPSSVI